MKNFDIYDRCENFVVNIINLLESIPYRKSVGVISDQLIRSSGSVGANLYEADNSRSKKEFLSCLSISLKEIQESRFWLKVLRRTNYAYSEKISIYEKEALELKLILGSIYHGYI